MLPRLGRCATPRSPLSPASVRRAAASSVGTIQDFCRPRFRARSSFRTEFEQPAGWQGEARLWQRTVALARRLGYGEEELRAELLRRRDLDQTARGAFAGASEDKARIIAMDDANTAWLRTVIVRVGWPGRTLVGADGAHAAWLIAQHADRHPAFQRRCLKLLDRAVACGEAAPADLAHLTDRVLLARGEPQLYGTQVSARAEGFVAARLRDPETVDARRAAMGLAPLADHLARARERFGMPRAARVACPSCGSDIEMWLPEPGGSTRVSCPSCGVAGMMHTRLRTAGAQRRLEAWPRVPARRPRRHRSKSACRPN